MLIKKELDLFAKIKRIIYSELDDNIRNIKVKMDDVGIHVRLYQSRPKQVSQQRRTVISEKVNVMLDKLGYVPHDVNLGLRKFMV